MKTISIEEYGSTVYGCVMAWALIKDKEYEHASSILEKIIENDIDKEILSLVVHEIGVIGGECDELILPSNN